MEASIKNTVYNVVSFLMSAIINFFIRIYLIKYLGTEVLGVNATISETINLLSMMELGIQSAIVYKMYAPINNNDTDRIRALFGLYKVAYRIIGIAIIVVGVCVLPFLEKIVNTNVDMKIVYAAFGIQLIITASSYFLGYYKLILNAYQRMHEYISVNIILNIVINLLQLYVVVKYQNYLIYISISFIQVLGLYYYTKYRIKNDYQFLQLKQKIEKNDIRNLFKDIKELLVGQIAGYIYGSTDNVLISYFWGSLTVGFISNYKMITSIIKSILNSLNLGPSASWGAFLNKDVDKNTVFTYFMRYTYVEYVALMILLVPTELLIDLFIYIIFGKDFIINHGIVILIMMDIYGSCISQPNCVIMNNLGMFKEEKRISTIAAIVNLALSISLTKIIGVEGIFIGTVVAVLVYWLYRFSCVRKRCFAKNSSIIFKYWIRQIEYISVFLLVRLICKYIINAVGWYYTIPYFILYGLMIEVITVAGIMIFWHKTDEYRFMIETIKNRIMIKRKG